MKSEWSKIQCSEMKILLNTLNCTEQDSKIIKEALQLLGINDVILSYRLRRCELLQRRGEDSVYYRKQLPNRTPDEGEMWLKKRWLSECIQIPIPWSREELKELICTFHGVQQRLLQGMLVKKKWFVTLTTYTTMCVLTNLSCSRQWTVFNDRSSF